MRHPLLFLCRIERAGPGECWAFASTGPRLLAAHFAAAARSCLALYPWSAGRALEICAPHLRLLPGGARGRKPVVTYQPLRTLPASVDAAEEVLAAVAEDVWAEARLGLMAGVPEITRDGITDVTTISNSEETRR